jgi:hypothetical protein
MPVRRRAAGGPSRRVLSGSRSGPKGRRRRV